MSFDFCEICGEESPPLVFDTVSADYVCTSCGLVAAGRTGVIYEESVDPVQVQYNAVEETPCLAARRLAASQRSLEKRNGPYNRRYYSNEKINQIRNQCPELKRLEMKAIGRPLLIKSKNPKLLKYWNMDPVLLTQSDIQTLCREAPDVRNERAERWIQIKWRLTNCPVWGEEEDDTPLRRPVNKADWDPNWPWQPDFLPAYVVPPLNIITCKLREAFDELKPNIADFPPMNNKKLRRKSMINWPWMIQRVLYMICPCCRAFVIPPGIDFAENPDPSCWAKRYSWSLKGLATMNNVECHVLWWYFLILYLARSTLYDGDLVTDFKWAICKTDTTLDITQYSSFAQTTCQSIKKILSPISRNPDLVPSLLRRSGPKSLRRSPLVRSEANKRPIKRQRLQTPSSSSGLSLPCP